ncbi:MAG: hypothetical protein GY880_12510 [Planctomycetaceae bacterium]|nr:hypothetical protein [Planctomycetaceae bacterium]
MRHYALTYQQLIQQAADKGFVDSELVDIRVCYDLAIRLTDGLYRKQTVPFICHLVRTGSIVMYESREPPLVLASMLHAVYFLHLFRGSTRRGPRKKDRHMLRNTIGPEVERLVSDYSQFQWGPLVAARWSESLDHANERTRQLLVMRLADELEDHLDSAEAFVPRGQFRAEDSTYGQEYAALARSMGRHSLAADFEEAVQINQRARLPAGVLSSHRSSFELRDRLMCANPIERLGSWVRRCRMRRNDR